MLSSVRGNVLDKILHRDIAPLWKVLDVQAGRMHLTVTLTLNLAFLCLKTKLITCGAKSKLEISPYFSDGSLEGESHD